MNWFKQIRLLENEMQLTGFTLGPLLNLFKMPVSWPDMFTIKKKSCSLALFHWMQLCFRSRKGLDRDSDLFFCTASPEDFTWGWFWPEDARVLFAVEGKQCRAAARKTLPHLLLPSGYSGESRKVWCHWSPWFPYKPWDRLHGSRQRVNLWRKQQGTTKQGGGTDLNPETNKLKRKDSIFNSSSPNNPVRRTPSLGWVTSGLPVAQTNS